MDMHHRYLFKGIVRALSGLFKGIVRALSGAGLVWAVKPLDFCYECRHRYSFAMI